MRTIDEIQDIVKEYKLTEKTRKWTVLYKRQYVAYYLRKGYKMPFEHIGSLLGVDHSTVLHSCRAVQNCLDTNDKLFFEYIEPITVFMPLTDITKKGEKARQEKVSYLLNGWLTEKERLKLSALRHNKSLKTNLEVVKYLIGKEKVEL